MSGRKTWLLPIVAAVVTGVFLFCNGLESPAARESTGHIWKDGDTEARPLVSVPTNGFAGLVDRLKPAVVNIYTTTVIRKRRVVPRPPFGTPFDQFFGGDLFRFFFGPDMEMPPMYSRSLGSGFIINEDGYILTNFHVVRGATEIRVKLASGQEYKAKVKGGDDKLDLALLKIDVNKKLPRLEFGDSDKLRVGEWVIAIGNPFGLAHTVTAGIVSAKDRVIGAGPYDDFIQTDASINPGNSGGPLINTQGLVVGINTAIHSQAQGIGFAVPINMAKKFIEDIVTKGKVVRGWLGVGIQDLTPDLARTLHLPTEHGALVAQVFDGSPAAKAGLRRGDVIVKYDGKPVRKAQDLTRLVGLTTPGTTVEIRIFRGQQSKTLDATIAQRTPEAGIAMGQQSSRGGGLGDLGLRIRPLPRRTAHKLGIEPGVGLLVDKVESASPAAHAGLRQGDIIIEINRVEVRSVRQASALVAKVKSGDGILMLILRGRGYFYAVVKKP